jgi:CBS domain-containing protein/sporulation protein YlmC with PRC-barrel domain
MPYVSELLNNKVSDSSDSFVGRLQDILIKRETGSFPALEFLVIKTPDKQLKFVPYEQVSNFSSKQIALKNLFGKIASESSPDPAGQYVYLSNSVLDKQIVDIAGTRVVRVNDLRIGNFNDRVSVLAIDASFRGLLRRLGLGDISLANLFPVRLIDWRQAEFLDSLGALQINTAAENLSQLHPADLANIIEDLGVKQGSNILASLEAKDAAKVLEEVDLPLQNVLVKYLGPDRAGKILAQMSTDEIVDLVKTFSNEEAKFFLSRVSGGKAMNIQRLIEYPDNTAGGLMTLDFVTVRPEWPAERVIEEIKNQSPKHRSIMHVYVTGEDNRFYGVISLRRLLVAAPATPVKKLMKTLAVNSNFHPDDDMDTIIKLMTRYNLYTAVVLDDDKKLAGVITIDDVMRQLFPQA